MSTTSRIGAALTTGANGRRRGVGLRAWLLGGSAGNAMIELALALPIMAAVLAGLYRCAVAFNNYLMLTNAANQGVYQLQQGAGLILDPCNVAYTAVTNAAPLLTPSNITFTLSLNSGADILGPTQGAFTCDSASYTSGAAGNLLSGTTVQLTIQYPVSLSIAGVNYIPGGQVSATSTEVVQ